MNAAPRKPLGHVALTLDYEVSYYALRYNSSQRIDIYIQIACEHSVLIILRTSRVS